MRRISTLTLILVGLLATSVNADRYTVNVSASGLSKYSPSNADLGDYYVLQFDPPGGLTTQTLKRAYLELYIDATARDVSGYADKSPLVEVYALKSAFTGQLDPSQFADQTIPAVRNVAVGSGRRVVIDITEIARSYLANPSRNHGLVIGSLSGLRTGVFSIRDDKLGGAAVARVTLFD